MAAPVGNTCPDIDRVLKAIKEAYSNAEVGFDLAESEANSEEMTEKDDLASLKYYFEEIKDQLYSLDSDLEDLRSANSALRDWGTDLERKVEGLEEELEERN